MGSVYYSSNRALEGRAECLAYEVAPFGIQIKLVQPGGFKTDFGGRSLAFSPPPAEVPEYQAMLEATQRMRASVGASLPEPKPMVTDAIYAAATEADQKKVRYPVFTETDMYGQLYALRKAKGADAQFAAVMAQLHPAS
mmetsp:Transcript_7932/g.20320  ORF Transcript_7932/g.20320 Transcript_7932/m.20320 type:complete len:139 (-) Transcript_7932:166-582(-)